MARKIGIILHRMWIDGTTYRWAEAKPIAAQVRSRRNTRRKWAEQRPYCPKSRRRDGGAGEAVTRPVAVIPMNHNVSR